VKLLRALQEGEIDPVGARKPVKVDFRLVSATNKDLMALVRANSFREDLFYRLHIYPVTLPPLRERMEDVPDLVKRFVARFAAEEGKRVRSVSADAMKLLSEYKWPGNVRQLENTVFRAVVLAGADEIGVSEFPQIASQVPGYEQAALQAAPPSIPSPSTQPSAPLIVAEEQPEAMARDRLEMVDFHGHVRPMEALEAEIIRFTIDHYRGRMTEVARRLGIGRSRNWALRLKPGPITGICDPAALRGGNRNRQFRNEKPPGAIVPLIGSATAAKSGTTSFSWRFQ
jgi:DNA-binding NtrC family response regulator